MKILIDFSLSESRDKLNKVLSEMRSRVAFELHDAIAVHENKISEEHDGADITILDSEAMVNNLVEQLVIKISSAMTYPHLVRVTDPDTDIQLILEKAFLHAATLHNLRHAVHYCLVDNVTITLDDNVKVDQLRREIVHKIEAYNRRFDRACARLTDDEALRKRLKLEIEYAAQRYGIGGTEPCLTEQEIGLAIEVYTTLCCAILKETNHEITKALLNTADRLTPILGQ